MLKTIDGKGSYGVGWIGILFGAAELMGWVPSGTAEQAQASLDDLAGTLDVNQVGAPALMILIGAAVIRLRMGIKKAENKAVEAIEAVKKTNGTDTTTPGL